MYIRLQRLKIEGICAGEVVYMGVSGYVLPINDAGEIRLQEDHRHGHGANAI